MEHTRSVCHGVSHYAVTTTFRNVAETTVLRQELRAVADALTQYGEWQQIDGLTAQVARLGPRIGGYLAPTIHSHDPRGLRQNYKHCPPIIIIRPHRTIAIDYHGRLSSYLSRGFAMQTRLNGSRS